MELANLIVVAPLAAAVFLPLAREYAEFRREWGLGPVASLLTTLLVLPALAIGLAVSLPLSQEPVLQWTTTVVVTVLTYSIAVSALRSAAASASPQRSS